MNIGTAQPIDDIKRTTVNTARQCFAFIGRRTEKWYPNGANTRYYWNDDSTQRQIVNRLYDGTLVSQNEYVYDEVGNRKTATEKVGTHTTPAQSQAFGYDPLNNRTYKTDVNTGTNYYIYDAANQLKEIRQTTATGTLIGALVHDDNGNLIKKCEGGSITASATACTGTIVTSLSYDVYNRLIQVAKSGNNTLSFDYDHQGRRISKSPGLGLPTRNYLYDGDNLYGDYASWTNPPSYLYVHGPNTDEPLIRLLDGVATPYFYHQDGLGSVVALTTLSGINAAQLFDAWGNRITSGSAIPQYGYTGREPEYNGLIYYRARHYDPSIGRFIQRDPIGFRGGLNFYAYVRNNPVNFTDPNGLRPPLPGEGGFDSQAVQNAAFNAKQNGGTGSSFSYDPFANTYSVVTAKIGPSSGGVSGSSSPKTSVRGMIDSNQVPSLIKPLIPQSLYNKDIPGVNYITGTLTAAYGGAVAGSFGYDLNNGQLTLGGAVGASSPNVSFSIVGWTEPSPPGQSFTFAGSAGPLNYQVQYDAKNVAQGEWTPQPNLGVTLYETGPVTKLGSVSAMYEMSAAAGTGPILYDGSWDRMVNDFNATPSIFSREFWQFGGN